MHKKHSIILESQEEPISRVQSEGGDHLRIQLGSGGGSK